MKAITITEPWASMIAKGFKSIETRSWSTSYRGRIAIHAGKRKPSKDWLDNVPEMMRMVDNDIHPGCIIAYADLIGCEKMTKEMIDNIKKNHAEYISGIYEPERYAFILGNVHPVTPIPIKGKQRIWNYDN